MDSALRSLLLASFVCGVTALLAPGCSQQGEGERCDRVKTQNSDCDSGLVCVPKSQLLDASSDRCCPATAGDESDERCRRGSASGEGGSPDNGEQPSAGGKPSAESSGGEAGMSTAPAAAGNGGASEEPNANGGAPSAGAPAAGGAPQAASGAAGAGGA